MLAKRRANTRSHCGLYDAFDHRRSDVASNQHFDFVAFLGTKQSLGDRRFIMDDSLGWIRLCPAYRDMQRLSVVRKVFDSHRVADRYAQAVSGLLALTFGALCMAEQRQGDRGFPGFSRLGLSTLHAAARSSRVLEFPTFQLLQTLGDDFAKPFSFAPGVVEPIR